MSAGGVRLPEKVVIVECLEHHFKNGAQILKECAVCGMSINDYEKFQRKKKDAESKPQDYDDWVIDVFNKKLACRKHRHKQKATEGGQ
jgi:hypothetical protein